MATVSLIIKESAEVMIDQDKEFPSKDGINWWKGTVFLYLKEI
jgi:hypothetical protein